MNQVTWPTGSVRQVKSSNVKGSANLTSSKRKLMTSNDESHASLLSLFGLFFFSKTLFLVVLLLQFCWGKFFQLNATQISSQNSRTWLEKICKRALYLIYFTMLHRVNLYQSVSTDGLSLHTPQVSDSSSPFFTVCLRIREYCAKVRRNYTLSVIKLIRTR